MSVEQHLPHDIDNDEVEIRIRFDADLWTSLNAADRAALVQNAIEQVSRADGVEHAEPIQSQKPQNSSADTGDTTSYLVSWEIDQEADSPALAAATVWQEMFGRGLYQPAADDACVFTVTHDADDPLTIDLSEEIYADLFDQA